MWCGGAVAVVVLAVVVAVGIVGMVEARTPHKNTRSSSTTPLEGPPLLGPPVVSFTPHRNHRHAPSRRLHAAFTSSSSSSSTSSSVSTGQETPSHDSTAPQKNPSSSYESYKTSSVSHAQESDVTEFSPAGGLMGASEEVLGAGAGARCSQKQQETSKESHSRFVHNYLSRPFDVSSKNITIGLLSSFKFNKVRGGLVVVIVSVACCSFFFRLFSILGVVNLLLHLFVV
ncbi:hypothetical protein E2C01_062456 [Portunus trituberculatus]|uniref:Uncharacterized protein n=1 Tax=Portunus trituberculatus TaxID=210409 RepID=A0A5B7HER1_PORTR|nr:hypothetical protein [Portunus trituberculatus]